VSLVAATLRVKAYCRLLNADSLKDTSEWRKAQHRIENTTRTYVLHKTGMLVERGPSMRGEELGQIYPMQRVD
jgi:hypothetical protein